MKKSTRPEPSPALLELPPVDPVELERAVRRAVEIRKPPGGWKRGAKKKPRGGEGA
jgi:hypothetical protein